MQATYCVAFANGAPVLPPMEELVYVDAEGNNHGGWVTLSYTPAPTCIVLVDTTPEMIATMSKSAEYVFMEIKEAASDEA